LNPTLDLALRLISASGIVTLVGLWWRRDIALRKLSTGEAGDIRDHYAKELTRYADEVERVIRRQLECETRERALRDRVMTLEDEITGLKRQIAERSADRLMVLDGRTPSESAPHAAASAERVKKIVENGK
jgi:hypothetical protein